MNKSDNQKSCRRSPGRRALSDDEIDQGREILESFEEERVSNKRTAKFGFLAFVTFTLSVIIYFEVTSDPHQVLQAKVIDLNIVPGSSDLPGRSYTATIKLGSGKKVNAAVGENMFDKLSSSDQVYVKFYDETGSYEIIDEH